MLLLPKKRLFIVEDNLENRAIMQMLLEQHGAKTAIERWGTDVIARLEKFAPVDAILLDLMLPHNITGYMVYDEIRSSPAFAETPIVAVSAADSSANIPKCRTHGFAGFIAKPVDFDLFPHQIASIIAGEQVWFTGNAYK